MCAPCPLSIRFSPRDVTFVELPKTGIDVKQFQGIAIIESVKAASDVFCPMAGKVIEINAELEKKPSLVNQACYADGWLIKLKIKEQSEKSNLMDAAAYKKFTEGLAH
jgi:glycine cleavage system H protein